MGTIPKGAVIPLVLHHIWTSKMYSELMSHENVKQDIISYDSSLGDLQLYHRAFTNWAHNLSFFAHCTRCGCRGCVSLPRWFDRYWSDATHNSLLDQLKPQGLPTTCLLCVCVLCFYVHKINLQISLECLSLWLCVCVCARSPKCVCVSTALYVIRVVTFLKP